MNKYTFLANTACLALACASSSKASLSAQPPPSPAQAALLNGNLLEAAALFSEYCQQNPLLYMADCLQAGNLWTELQHWEQVELVLKPIANPLGSELALEACFPLAFSYFERGQLEEAASLLKPIAEYNGPNNRWQLRAKTEYAICLLEQGERTKAQLLLETVAASSPSPEDELEQNSWAKAKFFLAEIAFLYFAESPFCNRCPVHVMAQEVEKKAQLLLASQELFVQTIQTQNTYWAIAAGMRIGELYETLYHHLLASPLPLEIHPENAESYRKEMRKLLRNLLGKALQNYESTLHTAERIGVTGFFARRTRERLVHLTQQLLDSPEDTPTTPLE
ncbi:MAG: tetratricopeptide repeat protein [Proteobacteria bacterium]|nr:tetratricopeptide repeat protein [Cystobacterineae bacterium]MCL2259564.1 tetratricopeptide repeat protein [Cystobacterineae bacterium]MCL2313954.1 tetratricopeptide repeat protein [Pseudomonadota bacterium]